MTKHTSPIFSILVAETGETTRRNPEAQHLWQPTQYANPVRYVSPGTYYARFRVCGKLIWKSLKTDKVTVAQSRLADMEKEERKKAERGRLLVKGKVLFEDALPHPRFTPDT